MESPKRIAPVRRNSPLMLSRVAQRQGARLLTSVNAGRPGAKETHFRALITSPNKLYCKAKW